MITIIFDDATDYYFARQRVLERLATIAPEIAAIIQAAIAAPPVNSELSAPPPQPHPQPPEGGTPPHGCQEPQRCVGIGQRGQHARAYTTFGAAYCATLPQRSMPLPEVEIGRG